MSILVFMGTPLGLSIINALLSGIYGFLAGMLFWFSKKEPMLRETTGFGYLFKFFISASFNRFAAVMYFVPGMGWLMPLALAISVWYAFRTGKYFYTNRHGIILAVSLRRRLIDADGEQ
jgi:hypothetical protein